MSSERRRTRKCPQRWPSISNIADATRLTSDSLLAFLLHSPHPAFVRVIEGTLNVPNGARRIGIGGASEGHQRDCDCKSSGPKSHLVSYRICLPPEIKSHAFRTNSYIDKEFLAQFTHKTFFGLSPFSTLRQTEWRRRLVEMLAQVSCESIGVKPTGVERTAATLSAGLSCKSSPPDVVRADFWDRGAALLSGATGGTLSVRTADRKRLLLRLTVRLPSTEHERCEADAI